METLFVSSEDAEGLHVCNCEDVRGLLACESGRLGVASSLGIFQREARSLQAWLLAMPGHKVQSW